MGAKLVRDTCGGAAAMTKGDRMLERRIRHGIGAAAAAALMVVPMAPAQAAEPAPAPCQFLMPIEPKDVVGCVCYRTYQIVIMTTDKEFSCAVN